MFRAGGVTYDALQREAIDERRLDVEELLRQICQRLDEEEWMYKVEDHEGGVKSIRIGMSTENFHGLDFGIFPDDEESTGIRCWGICTVPEEDTERMIQTANMLNDEYRWVKFVVDDDGDFNAQVDVEGTEETAAELTMRGLHRMIRIVDKAYPAIMRARFA